MSGSASGITPSVQLSRARRLQYVVVLGLLTTLGPFTIDLAVPASPSIAREMVAPDEMVQLTLAGTIVGFAIGQLIVGPWSDAVGRRLPIVLATAMHVGASLASAAAVNVEMLIGTRFLMGAAAAASGVVAIAVVRDLYVGLPMIRMLSNLALVNGLAPILAPIIGTQLLLLIEWRGIFLALGGYALLIGLLIWVFLPESWPAERRVAGGARLFLSRARALAASRVFVGLTIVAGACWGADFAYLAVSPFILSSEFGLQTADFSWVYGLNAVAYVGGVQCSSRLASRMSAAFVVALGTGIHLVSGVLLLVLGVFVAPLWGVLGCLWFLVFSVGLCIPSIQATALAPHGANAGTAAALLGATSFGIAGIVTSMLGLARVESSFALGILTTCTGVLATLVLWIVVRPATLPSLQSSEAVAASRRAECAPEKPQQA